jgi:taurine--2-oxoglutarate transaminase
MSYPECDIQCARYLDYLFKEEGNVAAFIVEPVVGTNGRIVPPPEYFPIVRQICDENDVLLIADEVMSGWFRTGKAFAMQNWNVAPDIMTTAKGASNAYTPVAITMTTEKVKSHFEDEFFCHGHTYAKKLYEMGDKHICVGDVRGIGHFWALEIVKDRETKEPFDTKADKLSGKALMTGQIAGDAMKNGLYMAPWYDTLVIAPPLIITEEQIDEAVDILDKALKVGDEQAVETDVAASHSSEYK